MSARTNAVMDAQWNGELREAVYGAGITRPGVEAILSIGDAVMFAPEQLARVSASTGLSLQAVAEVARELRKP